MPSRRPLPRETEQSPTGQRTTKLHEVATTSSHLYQKMNSQLTIVNKGLLLVALPLVVQVVFMGMLVHTHTELNSAQEWAVHTKEVIARVEEIYRRLLEGYTGIHIVAVSNQPSIGRPFREALTKMPTQLEELRLLTSDNDQQGPRLELVARQIETFRDWLATQERLLQSGQRGEALDGLDQGARLLGSVRTTTDAILAEEEQLDNDRMARLHKTATVQSWTLIAGGLAFLGTTLALAVLFLNGVIKRLTVLKDNARRFAEGEGLAPPLEGSDEIAQVDRAFHDMATSLNHQKQENEMFVYSVSHDLRSPLINLQGFSEELSLSYRELEGLFRHAGIPPAVREQGLKLMSENIEDSIRYIQTAVGRLARIIDALLRLSRAGRVEYHWQTLDLQTMIRKIVDALHDTIAAKKVEVVVGELPPSRGDPTAVEQIFANLIGNAVNYLDGARSGTIEVGCTDSELAGTTAGFHVYFIKDNGLGIPEAYQQRVFTAFSRLHADVAQGEGIGLALVRRMVERHGGKIWLHSAAGAGSTFFVALPAPAPDRPPPAELERQAATQGSKGEKQTWQPSRS
jgi:signal transduction histidine kinase